MLEMTSSEWHLSLKLVDQPKSMFHFPEMMPGDVTPGGYRVSTLKQLVAAQLSDSIQDPDLIELVHCGRKLKDDLTLDACGIQPGSTLHILRKTWPEPEINPEPVNRATAAREFRVFHAALHSLNSSYRDSEAVPANKAQLLTHHHVIRATSAQPPYSSILRCSMCRPTMNNNNHQQYMCRSIMNNNHQQDMCRPTMNNNHQQYMCRPTMNNNHQQNMCRSTMNNNHQQYMCRPTTNNDHQQYMCRHTMNNNNHQQYMLI